MTTTETHTLDQQLTDGTLSVAQALRTAGNLATALRRMHDEGRVHGALTTASVEVTSSGVELLPPQTPRRSVTPYTAPEVLRGRPADARSDIFSFGAIVYEMVTGHVPFEGETPEALTDALLHSATPSTENPALDALLTNCLAKDPEARCQAMQKAQLELRLLMVSARRAEGPARRDSVETVVRSEVQRAMESRITGRLESQERAVTELKQAVSASLQAFQAHLCTIDAKLAAAQERAVRSEEAALELHLRMSSLEQRVEARQERLVQAGLLIEAATERIGRAEQATETVRREAAQFAEEAAGQLDALEQTVDAQADALESARRSMAHTDDLVERVVEALDSLQSIVLERAEERPSSVN